MKKNKYIYLVVLFAAFYASSCSKKQEQPVNEIKFTASYNTGIQAKASSTFTAGNKVTILGFSAGSSPATSAPLPGTPVEASSGASGVLSPSSEIYLTKGNYDFYCVSKNNSESPGLTFSGGYSQQLENGVDYIWAKSENVANGGTASFVFHHSATGISLNITEGSGVSDIVVKDISISPSLASSDCRMNLADGTIGAASSLGSPVSVSVSGNIGSMIMLPAVSVAIPVEVTIDATIGGNSVVEKKYQAVIPSQTYQSGLFYKVGFIVKASSIQFTGAQIDDWTSQTIPDIYLTEK